MARALMIHTEITIKKSGEIYSLASLRSKRRKREREGGESERDRAKEKERGGERKRKENERKEKSHIAIRHMPIAYARETKRIYS